MMKDIWKTILLGGVLYYGAGPNAAVDLQTGQVDPVVRGGSTAYVLTPPTYEPRYAVPMPDGGAGPSLYINPTPGEGE